MYRDTSTYTTYILRTMNIKNILTLALAIGAAVSVQATNVGVLLGRSGHNKEWYHEFDKLGWDVSRYECTPDGMKNFAESSASLDFVLVPPLTPPPVPPVVPPLVEPPPEGPDGVCPFVSP